MTAAVAVASVVRNRRALAAGIGTLALSGLLVMSVVVVAMAGTAPPPPAELAAGLGIPPAAMDAYQRAASSTTGVECGLRWQILAAVGRVESNHATGRGVDADGTVTQPIIGPALDGSGNTARIADTDGGALDGDPTWDHAVGPMQFLPSSWQRLGVDANDDGTANPNNLYDAAAAAAAHLCATTTIPLTDRAALATELLAYNHSDAYVADVLGWVDYYDQAALTGPAGTSVPTGNLITVRGITVDASIAAPLDALLDAATQDGLTLGGGGYRSHDQQIALRRAHCGTSTYAVYEMAADACTPPTARPGESLHESGLAIDFTCAGTLLTRADQCFAWLAANAASFGLYNLPSEPWHWSTSGR